MTAVTLAACALLAALGLFAALSRSHRHRITPTTADTPAYTLRRALNEPAYLDDQTLIDRTHGGI